MSLQDKLLNFPARLVLVTCLLGFIIYQVFINPEKELTIHDKKGIDTIYESDSAYVIQFKIIKAFEIEQDYEPEERN